MHDKSLLSFPFSPKNRNQNRLLSDSIRLIYVIFHLMFRSSFKSNLHVSLVLVWVLLQITSVCHVVLMRIITSLRVLNLWTGRETKACEDICLLRVHVHTHLCMSQRYGCMARHLPRYHVSSCAGQWLLPKFLKYSGDDVGNGLYKRYSLNCHLPPKAELKQNQNMLNPLSISKNENSTWIPSMPCFTAQITKVS